jgi:hypothetical protein
MNNLLTTGVLLSALLVSGCGYHVVSATDHSVMLSGVMMHSEECAKAKERAVDLFCNGQWKAAKIADNHCRQFGKQAKWVPDAVPDGFATYECVN